MTSSSVGRSVFLHAVKGIFTYFTIIGCMVFALWGCKTDTMSVQEAQKVALDFQETYKAVPPRGLGATIERGVAYYKDPPKVPAEFLVPQKKYTDAELNHLYKGHDSKGYQEAKFYYSRAYDEFLRGNLSLAIRIVDLAPSRTKLAPFRASAFSFKAIFLAAAGDYRAAEIALAMADGYFRTHKRFIPPTHPRYLLTVVHITKARAALYFARGDLAAAEREYRRLMAAIDKFRHLGRLAEPTFHEPEARVNLARVLLARGRPTEAEIYVREAIRWGHGNIMPDAYITLSGIFFEQGRFEDARVCARTALHSAMALRAPIDAYIRAKARDIYARSLFATGRYGEALEQYNQIEKDLATDPKTFNRRFKGSAEWGLALLMSGDARGALEKFDFAAKQGKEISRVDAYTLAELGALRAMALLKAGRRDAALASFDREVPVLLKNWQAGEGDGSSHKASSFKFKLILEAYMSILAETGKPADAAKSFLLANTLQDRIIGRAVAMSSARAAVKDPALAGLIRQRQDLEMKLTAFKNRLASSLYAPPELINTEVVIELRTRVTTLNEAVNALEAEIHNRFPGYASIIDPPDISVAEVQNTIREQEALVSIFSGRQSTFIWAVPKQGPVVMAKVPIGREKMAAMVGNLRKALNPGDASTPMEIPPFDLELAHDLFAKTLKPVAAGWQQAESLLVVTQGPIGQIPLTILPTTMGYRTENTPGQPAFANYRDVAWLIKTHSVTVLPSVAALVNLRAIAGKKTERLAYAGFGDPYFNREQMVQAENETGRGHALLATRSGPIQVRGIRVTEAGALDKEQITSITIGMLNRLPDTREEVLGIAKTLGADESRDVFIGRKASEQTVKALDLSNRKVVVFATHGLVPGDLDGLDQPALALSAPEVTGNRDNDGLLTMGEIMGLRLNADWVVLSACNTGAAEGNGAEAVSGLGQAFFYAGARSLLVTGWPVETISARILTTDLFKRQLENPEIDRARALRFTMLNMITKNHDSGFSYAHPIFWAPFAIVGDGRR